MKLNNIYKEIAEEYNLPKEVIKEVYEKQFLCIKELIENLVLKKDYTEEEFFNLKTSFNLPSLGKLHCNYDYYKKLRTNYKNKYDKD